MADNAEWQDWLLENIAAPSRNAMVGGPFGSDLVSSDYSSAGIPVIRGENLSLGRWVGGDFVFVPPAKAQQLSANTAGPLDIVFTQRGANHYRQVAVIPKEAEGRFVISQSQMKLTVDAKKADPLFVYYLFRAPRQQQYLQQNAIQTGVPHTNLSILRRTPVQIPRLSVQQAIARVLGALDDKIELSRRMNATLEAIARGIFKDWFVDFGPTKAKMEGRQPYLAPEIWKLFPDRLDRNGKPELWEEKQLSEFFDIVGGGTPKTSVQEYWDGDIPWFSVVDTPNDGGVFVHNTEKTITSRGIEESSVRLVPPGTTIISARGTVGNLAIAAREMTFNQSCYALRGKNPVGDYFVFLAAQHMVKQLQLMAHGSVFSTITRQTFDALTLPMTAPAAFKQFEALVEPLFAKQKSSSAEALTLEQIRDLLIPKLMSGEIRVRDAEKIAEAAA